MIRNLTFLFAFALVIAVHGQGSAIKSLSALKLEFEMKRAELLGPLDELNEKYAEQLDQLLNQVAQAGDLEKALTVKAEIEGFKSGNSMPADESFIELKRLQGIYAGEHAKRSVSVSEKLGQLISSHQADLFALQTHLTVEKKLDEALKVKAEIGRLDELAKATASKTSDSPGSVGTASSLRIGSPVEALTAESGGNELAVVKVENERWGNLREGEKSFSDADYKWEKVPESLKNVRFSLSGKHSHTLRFVVEKPGFVFIATSTRFPANRGSGDSWEAEALDLKGLRSSGWRHVRQFDGLSNDGTGSVPWMVFYKVCDAGEVHSIRTEKYAAPVLLVKRNSR